MYHGSSIIGYIVVLTVFNGFVFALNIISFAKLYKKLPENTLIICKYIFAKGWVLNFFICFVNIICIFGSVYTLFYINAPKTGVLHDITECIFIFTFLVSYAINFSYRFFVNNKNFNLVASNLDRKIYKINNVILAISLIIIAYFKYFQIQTTYYIQQIVLDNQSGLDLTNFIQYRDFDF